MLAIRTLFPMLCWHLVCRLLLMGRFSHKLYKAYTLFFVVGTLGAVTSTSTFNLDHTHYQLYTTCHTPWNAFNLVARLTRC